MRSKYSVSYSERVANAAKTITVHGLTLELVKSTRIPFYQASLSDAELATFWQQNSNGALDLGADAAPLGEVKGLRLVRFTHLATPYTSVTIPAEKALTLIESGEAVEGIALQPALAG